MNVPSTQILPRRTRAAGPLLAVLAVWAVFAVMLVVWGGKWFGATPDSTLRQHLLGGDAMERRNALLELAGRMKRRDGEALKFYPTVLRMADSPDPAVRGGAAWVMGNDTSRNEFHEVLVKLLADSSPAVQANAAVSLTRFNDPAGHQHLIDMLRSGDPDAVWEALRALKAVGTKGDLPAIAPYEAGSPKWPPRVMEEAKDAAQAIRDRE